MIQSMLAVHNQNKYNYIKINQQNDEELSPQLLSVYEQNYWCYEICEMCIELRYKSDNFMGYLIIV